MRDDQIKDIARIIYTGTVQKNPELPRYIQMNERSYTPYQNELYRRALKGLNHYPVPEIRMMHRSKRKRIKRVHRRALAELNLLKQEYMQKFLETVFTTLNKAKKQGDTLINFLRQYSEPDPDFLCTLNFRDVGLTKPVIVDRFIEAGILPKNFYSLKQPPNASQKENM